MGSRSGEQVDLRYYAGVSGIMDTNLQPFATDAQGNLIRIHNLYGIEVSGGVYGVHSWKRSQLGLDYRGSYHKYLNDNVYNGSDQSLTLGFTHQTSRRLAFDLRESVGTVSLGTGQLANAVSNDLNSSFTPTTLLFDNRTNYLQSTAFATWTQSARMSYSVGGSAFLQDRKSQGLSNSWGYDFTGSAMRRLSKSSSVGANYVHSHYEFPGFLSRSDSNTYHGTYATAIGRFWTFSLEAGMTVTEVESPVSFTLNPVLAALFGQSTVTGTSYFRSTYPSGTATLKRRFRSASLAFNYFRGLNSGNGAYSTGRMDNATVSISYTGIRKLNVGLDGGYSSLSSIGQFSNKYTTYFAATGLTYSLGHAMHLSMRYYLYDPQIGQQIAAVNYRRTSSHASIGLLFSPGNLPLALW